MKLLLHKHRTIEETIETDEGKKVQTTHIGLFGNEENLRNGLYISLERIEIIRGLISGLSYGAFESNLPIVDRCAISIQIIGNQVGQLDPALQVNEPMKTIHKARDIVAHVYGTKNYKTVLLWNSLINELDDLESGIRQALETVDSAEEIVFLENRKNRRSLLKRRKI